MEYTRQQPNGCKEDFEKIFQEFSDVIYRLCLYKTSKEEVARDLTQEAFLRLWKSISAEREINKPKEYLYQITRNLIVDYYRLNKPISLDQLQEEGFDPKAQEESPAIAAEISILRETIDSLEPEFREVIYLRFVEDMKIKEIAQTLGITENLASVRINRGKKKLNEKFS